MKSKSGFGLMEVLVAAVVLGFLIVGLTQLQKGNREGVLRIRARDAANFVAQHVLDSLSSLGINSIRSEDGSNIIINNELYTYRFEGKPELVVDVDYEVKVTITDEEDINNILIPPAIESTNLTKANRQDGNIDPSEKNFYAKNLEATVSWTFRNSKQSITMAKVVR